MIQLLLQAGAHDLPAEWANNEESAIWWAVQSKNLSMIKLLCDHGSDPNLLDVAISIGSMNVTRELLAHKADPNRDDIQGYKPLHNAAVFDHADIADLLIKAGADPNAPTGEDHRPCGSPFNELATPLHLAAQAGSTNMISLLIKAGAKLNTPDDSGRTPLHYAAGSYRPPTDMLSAVTALVNAKVDINAEDKGGRTPLDEATHSLNADKPNTIIVDYLRSHGAKPGAP
jgi:ankyrin repeat protein